jgi:ribosomal protein L29
MKKDKKQTIKDMSVANLHKRLEEINREITDNNMKLSAGSLKNVHASRVLRKERAFIKLLLSQKTQEKEESNK